MQNRNKTHANIYNHIPKKKKKRYILWKSQSEYTALHGRTLVCFASPGTIWRPSCYVPLLCCPSFLSISLDVVSWVVFPLALLLPFPALSFVFFLLPCVITALPPTFACSFRDLSSPHCVPSASLSSVLPPFRGRSRSSHFAPPTLLRPLLSFFFCSFLFVHLVLVSLLRGRAQTYANPHAPTETVVPSLLSSCSPFYSL